MQIFAIVVSLAITVVGGRAVRQAIRAILATVRIGQPAVGRTDHKARPLGDDAQGDARPHPDAAVDRGRRRALVRLRRVRAAVLDPGDGVRPAVRPALRAAADRALVPLRVGHGALHRRRCWSRSSAFIGYRATRPRERARGRRAGSSARRCGRATSSRRSSSASGCASSVLRGAEYAHLAVRRRPGRPRALHYPFTFWIGEALLDGLSESALANVDLPGRDGQDRHLVHLDDRDLAEHRRWASPGTGSPRSSTSGSSARPTAAPRSAACSR